MARLPRLEPGSLSPEQRKVHDEIASGPRGSVRGPLEVWLRSPQLADHAQRLGAFCRFGTTLPPRLSELAILVTAAHWRAGLEWHGHAPLGEKAGIDSHAIAAIRVGKTPALKRDDELAVYRLSTELLRDREVSDPTWAQAVGALGETAIVELIGVLGYYALISMTIKACRIDMQAGARDPFEAQ